MLGLQPSEGSDCHCPTPSEAGGKLKKRGEEEKTEAESGKRGRRGDRGDRAQLGGGDPCSPWPLVSPVSSARIHYEGPGGNNSIRGTPPQSGSKTVTLTMRPW